MRIWPVEFYAVWLTMFPFSWLMYCHVRAFYCLLRPKRACPLALACHGRHPCGVKQKSMGSRDKSAKSGSDIVLYVEAKGNYACLFQCQFWDLCDREGGGRGTAVLCKSEKKISYFHAFIFDRHREVPCELNWPRTNGRKDQLVYSVFSAYTNVAFRILMFLKRLYRTRCAIGASGMDRGHYDYQWKSNRWPITSGKWLPIQEELCIKIAPISQH